MIQGTIIRVAGPVVDVQFTAGKLPALQEALTVTAEGTERTMEVTQHVNETTVRCIMLSASEGLGKGMTVTATGHGLTAPVGEATLGRMFDPLGRPIDGKGKYLLRHAFEGDWLPHDILMREKAAFSDAVGHSMVDDLKAYAEQKYTDEEFETLRRKYDFAQPFTKESLLYRELFEQYYPGQAHMIVDFWMPNKSWDGCDVDDPSARVLANYGDSGK